MPEAARSGAAKAGEAPRSIDLALQGGGSHGAFTWGVLDALLEDGRIAPDGASGTSAGAMNAVVLAHGLARARHDGLKGQDVHEAGRAALKRFWENVGLLGNFSTGLPLPAAQAVASRFSQWNSPAQANPLGANPLRPPLHHQEERREKEPTAEDEPEGDAPRPRHRRQVPADIESVAVALQVDEQRRPEYQVQRVDDRAHCGRAHRTVNQSGRPLAPAQRPRPCVELQVPLCHHQRDRQ